MFINVMGRLIFFLEACVTPHALKRENIMVKLTTTLDIFTDVLRGFFTPYKMIELTYSSHLNSSHTPLACQD